LELKGSARAARTAIVAEQLRVVIARIARRRAGLRAVAVAVIVLALAAVVAAGIARVARIAAASAAHLGQFESLKYTHIRLLFTKALGASNRTGLAVTNSGLTGVQEARNGEKNAVPKREWTPFKP
jgi:hypothetical protein